MEKDIGKIKKNDDTDIVIRIDDFGGRPGLTIREFVTSERYSGFTKAGTRIPADKFAEFKKAIDSIHEKDFGSDSSHSTSEKPHKKEEVENANEEDGLEEDYI